jgi:hypothetical protein
MKQWVSANVEFSTAVAGKRDCSLKELAGSIASAQNSQSNYIFGSAGQDTSFGNDMVRPNGTT